jgi:hypothetical protein
MESESVVITGISFSRRHEDREGFFSQEKNDLRDPRVLRVFVMKLG